MKQYDVLISGASVSGLYSGYALAKAGLSVLIVDRRDAIGTPVRCGEATGNRKEIERFIPYDESYIARKLTGLAVHLNGKEQISAEMDDTGVILHRDRFEQFIADLARESGAEILLNTTVTRLLPGENETYRGVELNGSQAVTGRYIIAADGAESFLGREAGLTTHLNPKDAFTSLQYRVKSDRLNDGKMHFFVGSKTIPNGYLWVFPKVPGELSIGAGLFGSHRKGEDVQRYLEQFLTEFYPDAERSKLITGCAPLNIAPKELVKGNLLIVGDAARMVNPLTAGGIMNALEAAVIMVKAVAESSEKDSLKPLQNYSKTWKRTPRFTQKCFYIAKELLLDSSDSDIEKSCRVMYQFLSKADRSKVFKIPLKTVFPVLKLYSGKFIKWLPYLIKK